MNVFDFRSVRALTECLSEPLGPEDQTVQSMPDASPTKWHRAHVTWFFETFVLEPLDARYRPFDPSFRTLFNSYYEGVGPRHPRPERGLITRPGVAEISRYRAHVDHAMHKAFTDGLSPHALDLVELGLHHEQQHQELLLMDIKHALSRNPTRPAYGRIPWQPRPPSPRNGWIDHPGGVVEIGHRAGSFAFDNEGPQHERLLEPFGIAGSLVTCGEWLDFIGDRGYQRSDLWMSDGWQAVQANAWDAPEYWMNLDGRWLVHTLEGLVPVDRAAPVVHVSWFEAEAFARWSGARLPSEAEWETTAPCPGVVAEDSLDETRGSGWYGAAWQWTTSSYSPYPRFRPAAGAVGEYNGKFMVNQYVLRGSAAVTPPGHARRTYRNFFPAHARWAYSGVRLARDA